MVDGHDGHWDGGGEGFQYNIYSENRSRTITNYVEIVVELQQASNAKYYPIQMCDTCSEPDVRSLRIAMAKLRTGIPKVRPRLHRMCVFSVKTMIRKARGEFTNPQKSA